MHKHGAAIQGVLRGWWLLIGVAAMLLAVLAEPRAEPAPADDAILLAADATLGQALRAGDKSMARKLLSLEFAYIDENGKSHGRRDFLADLKAAAAAPASDAASKIYGRIATVTGHRKSASNSEVFFLDIWAKQKGAWRALVMQDVAVDAADPPAAGSIATSAAAKPEECKNPCQEIPYRVRSPAEQDVINSFQAIEKAAIAHDADEWSKHIADEFVLYGSGREPIAKSSRIAAIKHDKETNTAVTVGEIETMRLIAYDNSAAMTATHAAPDGSRPPYRAACVWVKRNGLWQMAISVQTAIK